MIEFSLSLLASLRLSGYEYVIVQNKGDHVILKPIHSPAPNKLLSSIGYYQLPITAKEILELSSLDSSIPSFLPEDFFDPNIQEYSLYA